MSVLAIGGAAVLGGLMPWRRRIWRALSKALDIRVPGGRVALDKTGLALIVSGGLGVVAFIGGAGGLAIFGGSGAGGGSPAFQYSAPNTPSCSAVAFATTGDSLRVVCNSFVGSGDDTQDSLHVQVDSAGKGFSSPQYWNVKLGAVLTDTVTALDSGSVVDIRVAVKGTNGGWSAFDSIMAVPMVPAGEAIFAMNYTSGAANLAGWATFRTNSNVTQSQNDGVGPSGEDTWRHVLAAQGSPPSSDVSYFGWRTNAFTDDAFDYGGTVCFSWAMKFNTGHNSSYYDQNYDPTAGNGGIGRTKVLILNDGGGAARTLVELWDNESDPQQWLIIIDDLYYNDAGYTAFDTNWHYIQLCKTFSSALNVADGSFRIWIDNAVEGSPDHETTGLTLNASGNPGDVQWMAYGNNHAYSDGVISWDHFGFQITAGFRTGWGS